MQPAKFIKIKQKKTQVELPDISISLISGEPINLKIFAKINILHHILMYPYNRRFGKIDVKIFLYDSGYNINAGPDNHRSVFDRPIGHYCS
jgi:hypothetical protein